jgi:hypothetical protein
MVHLGRGFNAVYSCKIRFRRPCKVGRRWGLTPSVSYAPYSVLSSCSDDNTGY